MFYILQFERNDFLLYFFFHLRILSFIIYFLPWKLIKPIEEYNVYYLEHFIPGWSILFGSFKKNNNKYEILESHLSFSSSWISFDSFFVSIEYSFKCFRGITTCIYKRNELFQLSCSYLIFCIDFYLNTHSAFQCIYRALCRSKTRRERKCTFSACSDSASSLSSWKRSVLCLFHMSIWR